MPYEGPREREREREGGKTTLSLYTFCSLSPPHSPSLTLPEGREEHTSTLLPVPPVPLLNYARRHEKK